MAEVGSEELGKLLEELDRVNKARAAYKQALKTIRNYVEFEDNALVLAQRIKLICEATIGVPAADPAPTQPGLKEEEPDG